MPMYEFLCSRCAKQFEKFVQKMDTESHPCPECGMDSERAVEKPSPFVWGKSGGWN